MKSFLILILLSIGITLAQTLPPEIPEDYAPLIATVSSIPLTFDIGSSQLFSDELGLLVGVALYPVPIFLTGEVNLDLTADLTYRTGVAPIFLLLSAGPRYSYTESDWLAGRGSAGSYAGGGASATLEFDFDLFGADVINFMLEAGADYTVGLAEGSSASKLSLRTGVGFSLPIAGLSGSF